jgi:methyl-accepting chemotaxis protein
MKFRDIRIKSKLVFTGIALTFIPLFIIMVTVFNQNQRVARMGEHESLKLAYADLDHIVENLYTLAESHQEVTQKNINASLNVARDLVSKAGGISFSDERFDWTTINQYTKAAQHVTLPKMLVGSQWLGQISSPNEHALVVDEVQKLVDVTCTIFQRMNPDGDMLRVASNVIKTNGQRAIGTYIPAINPDGKRNPVVSTVLKGETFRGRAFVVNAWYITAYEPIYDSNRKVVGVLYVGIPQENVKSLRQAIMDMTVGQTGFVTVLDSSGKYIISKKGKQDNISVIDNTDADGNAYIKERIQMAKGLSRQEIGHQQFTLNDENSGQTTKRDARFVFFKPWDWIVTAEANASDFTEVATKLNSLGNRGTVTIVAVGIVALVLTGLVWIYVAGSIVKPIKRTVDSFKDIAQGEGDLTKRLDSGAKNELGDLAHWFNVFLEKLQGIIGQIAGNSGELDKSASNLADIANALVTGASETSKKANKVTSSSEEMSQNLNNVAAAMEESSTNAAMVATATEEMSTTISEIAQNAEKARSISNQAVNKAGETSKQMDGLGKAAQGIDKVVETITEISEQVNLLALNATIEAARAGEAGKGFAVVANEIKELAKQTSEATFEIKSKIENIQVSTHGTVHGINEIKETINDVNSLVGSIAAAVEEQSASTQEIANNINQASHGITEVNENVNQSSSVAVGIASDIAAVNQSSSKMANNSDEVKNNVQELQRLARELHGVVASFKI